jgi:hypothetical protein
MSHWHPAQFITFILSLFMVSCSTQKLNITIKSTICTCCLELQGTLLLEDILLHTIAYV